MHVVPNSNTASGGGHSNLSLRRDVKRLDGQLMLVYVVIFLKDVVEVPHFDAPVHRGGDYRVLLAHHQRLDVNNPLEVRIQHLRIKKEMNEDFKTQTFESCSDSKSQM